MSRDFLETSLDAVKLPGKALGRAFSNIAAERDQSTGILENQLLVEMTTPPITFNASDHNHRTRWRAACLILHSVIAFSQARDVHSAAAGGGGGGGCSGDDQNELRDNLLQPGPTEEIAVDIKPEIRLADLACSKTNIEQLNQLGGVKGVALYVGSDSVVGIPGDDEDIGRRLLDYGSNATIFQTQPPKILHVLLDTIRDPIIIVLLICAVLALGFGVKHHGKAGLSDGVIICSALLFVIAVTAVSNLWPKLQLFKLSKAREEFNVSVLRNGRRQSVSVSEAVVGDVVFLDTGDQVPADGLYLDGSPLQVDESNVRPRMGQVEVDDHHNPFLLSGSKVVGGSGRMLVTAVGRNTALGKLLSIKIRESESDHHRTTTPLQKRLRELAKLIAKTGVVVASMVLLVLLIRYFIGNLHDDGGKPHFVAGKTKGSKVFDDVIGILATPIAIASTAIPEGLLMAVFISIAFSIKKMTAQKAQVTNFSVCEAIGATTVICTDERCNLTLNHLAVTDFLFGNNKLIKGPSSEMEMEILRQVVYLADLADTEDDSPPVDSARLIKDAIREWGIQDLGLDIEQVTANYSTIHLSQTFNSEKTQKFTRIKNKTDGSLHAYRRGEPETILPICSHYYDEDGKIEGMPDSLRENLLQIIEEMQSKGLLCRAFAHKNMSEESNDEEDGNLTPKLKEECLILIGIVGMTYSCRPGVKKAVEDCKRARVEIKLVTRNELPFARAIAIECGILEANRNKNTGEVVEGQEFQTYADDERLEKSLGIRVMARATTFDKHCMVQCLKKRGEVVAVTGDTTGDAIVLMEADVGISMGIRGTEQAKANSDVIILDDNFDSAARVLTWGRSMLLKIQLYAQFQFTVSTASLVIDFVTAVSAREPPTFNIVTTISSGKVPFATFQVLWVKLIVGALAAVAITVEEPAELWQLPKVEHDQQFVTNTMLKNIVGQALYPIVTLLIIQFLGQSTFKLDSRAKDTMIFNTFVLWQLCVMLSTKGIERNIFKGMCRRKLLWLITGFIVLLQVMIVEPLHKCADTKPLTGMQWMGCVGIAVVAWPYGWLIQNVLSVPEKPFFSESRA